MQIVRKSLFAAALLAATALSATAVSAETISGALAKAYKFNSSFNSARAGTRVTDENVAIAKSGYRPTVNATGNIQYSSNKRNPRLGLLDSSSSRITTGAFGIELQQNLFDGFQTKNNVAAAEAQVRSSFENLRNTEMNTLFNAASAYMDVIRDRRIAVLTEQNLEFLNEQARAARSRLEVGEGTRTDVAQADASRSSAVASLSAARAQALTSAANYREIVGEEPGNLSPASPLAKLLPKSVDAAYSIALTQHPAVLALQHVVDATGFQVKSAEGQLLPQITGLAGVETGFTNTEPFTGNSRTSDGNTTSASVGAQLTIPIYQGGRTSAQVRQLKEQLGQARIDVDVTRDNVRQAVASAWSAYVAAQEGVAANREVVAAAQLALNGVIEERNVGQRTTLDVLNAQQDVINAQVNLATSERDVVVNSYAILSAIGTLYAKRIGLAVAEYRPEEHYRAVKDKWGGLRTPDGR
ncbi:TolC family outer membrane protein [Mesorhizobium sp. LHD-90]|uniref:TolC family outer membrane protein n=1 Tax=Mesorhizobium sp. LHD-90 TaxID=3071414 RepID=UPI0027E13B8D|nr:TolC family outer membrane protein [Mesorhizobium sp. LHD-90]MDQ6437912.1 TolC family outer membrane protein [Mesorhizobium sp. LHD-90]